MQKISAWMFLVIALTWLLEAINVTLGTMAVYDWIRVVALVIVGIFELKA